MKTAPDHRLEPSEIQPEILHRLEEMVQNHPRPALLGPRGEQLELPEALSELLVFVVDAMQRQQAIVVMPEDAALTTQAAAQLVGMSRPYLVRLLDAGQIPFHRIGTHRRIRLSDLRAYQTQRDRERRSRLDALGRAVDEAGVYDTV